jgi:hypothetical protein
MNETDRRAYVGASHYSRYHQAFELPLSFTKLQYTVICVSVLGFRLTPRLCLTSHDHAFYAKHKSSMQFQQPRSNMMPKCQALLRGTNLLFMWRWPQIQRSPPWSMPRFLPKASKMWNPRWNVRQVGKLDSVMVGRRERRAPDFN